MKKSFLFACLLAFTSVCFAQNDFNQDSVQITDNNLQIAKKPVIPSGRKVLSDMRINNPEMFSQYRSGKKMQRTGIIMSGVSGGFIIVGAIFYNLPDADRGSITIGPYVTETDGDNSGFRKAGPVLMVAGGVGLSVGLPVMIVGGKKKKQAFQDFKDQYYLSQQPSSYLQMNIYPGMVGIAYMF